MIALPVLLFLVPIAAGQSTPQVDDNVILEISIDKSQQAFRIGRYVAAHPDMLHPAHVRSAHRERQMRSPKCPPR
jgi:hypothetical protein